MSAIGSSSRPPRSRSPRRSSRRAAAARRASAPVATTQVTMAKSYRFDPKTIERQGRRDGHVDEQRQLHAHGQGRRAGRPQGRAAATASRSRFDKPGTYHYVCTLHSQRHARDGDRHVTFAELRSTSSSSPARSAPASTARSCPITSTRAPVRARLRRSRPCCLAVLAVVLTRSRRNPSLLATVVVFAGLIVELRARVTTGVAGPPSRSARPSTVSRSSRRRSRSSGSLLAASLAARPPSLVPSCNRKERSHEQDKSHRARSRSR